jgi:hypothetical protein
MTYTVKDVGAVFTNCLFPDFTERAVCSVKTHYPDMECVIVDDRCRDDGGMIVTLADELQVPLLRNDSRRGTGRSIDRGLRALHTPLFVTVDHGVELRVPGVIEMLLARFHENEKFFCVGRSRADKMCNRAWGPYIDPVFALWDRQWILDNPDLSFKLTNITIGDDWHVDGCSTAQFLEYRSLRLGRELGFIRPSMLYKYVRHHKTPRTRGRCASPHELVEVDEDYLPPRRRRPDGSLLYRGKKPRKK